jgi:Trk K+ transport system NAD-binding subunit
MRQPVTARDRFRYRFDNFMSKGPIALVGALFVASLLVIVVGGVLIYAFNASPMPEGATERPGLTAVIWAAAMRTMDAGTLGGDDGSKLYLALMLLVTLGGIFIVSAFIGVLNSGLEAKLEELRKGRSRVIEENHVLILGWSPQVFTIVSELCAAAENQQGGTCIVVLADKDKVEMEDEIATKVPDLRGSRVVCRNGSPIDLDDLDLGSPEVARAIVVIGPEDSEDPDASVIKTILALVGHKPREGGKHHIVAEIRDLKNRVPARMVGRDQVELVMSSDVIARIAVQTCRQSGLSAIYTELLDFGGDEIYFHKRHGLAGKTFGDSLDAFERGAVIGLRGADGKTQLLPKMDLTLTSDDELIVIAEDDDKIGAASSAPKVDEAKLRLADPKPREPERTLILGWNGRGATVVSELDKYAMPGSELTIIADDDAPGDDIDALETELVNHKVRTVKGDINDRRVLDGAGVSGFQHVITLSYADKRGVQEADAITLVTLLHLRDIEEKNGETFSVVSEMLDARNQKLAEITKTDDFIVSENLISLLLAQLTENKALGAVFEDLFDADGAEIYLKDAGTYVATGEPVDFYAVVEAARRRGEIAIGFDIADKSGKRAPKLNPKKGDRVTFAEGDRVVVIADN